MNATGDILICDDEKVHSTVIRFYLQRAGINNPVLYFDNGRALLEHLKTISNGPVAQRCLSMVLLDIKMPGMNGVDLLRAIKNDPVFGETPVIMITTTDDPADIDKCLETGCEAYISKPIVYKLFSAAVLRVMKQTSHSEPSRRFQS